MSVLRIKTEGSLKGFKKFGDDIPGAFVHYLTSLSKKGRMLLRKDLLSGQALNLKSDLKDSRGIHLISGKPTKNFSITFASYPTNLYERGRTLRDGKKEPGRYIITRQFKNLLNANLQGFSEESLRTTLKKRADRI